MNQLASSLVIVSVVAVASCKKAKQLSSSAFQDRAKALAAKYGPKVSDLSKHLPDLAAHAKDLPVNVPGADKLGKLITDNKSELASAQELLDSLPERLASETPEQADKDLAEADKELATETRAAEQDEKAEASIESEPGAGSAATGSAATGSAATGSAAATTAAGSGSAAK